MISYLLNADNGDRPIPIHQLATQSVSETVRSLDLLVLNYIQSRTVDVQQEADRSTSRSNCVHISCIS